ncbi:hypothetical protein Lesp02_04220 [Lentzea sp. NBRC 105346]|uniref:hypothetical protein n=1 Tax=Lentzea sp. NBRC 105346 TaxID=3032205 RepID=UPI0024A5ADDB|nr:hypothetical protein [Lentzea sp. NBRC 105346]GLZ28232.1 hypothetical protein Lesp02_04220 [Lentzea sp. NBRC 105346]
MHDLAGTYWGDAKVRCDSALVELVRQAVVEEEICFRMPQVISSQGTVMRGEMPPPTRQDATSASGRVSSRSVAEVLVSAVVPRLAPNRVTVQPLPNVNLGTLHRDGSTLFGMATIDDHGRLADRQLLQALGWTKEHRLEIALNAHAILVRRSPEGALTLTSKGLVQIPAPVRRWSALSTGDRVLLVAMPEFDLLVLYGQSTLDAMLVNFYTRLDLDNGSPTTGVR